MKFLPLFFLYSIYTKFFNWWKLPYFFKYRIIKNRRFSFSKKQQHSTRFRWKRYNMYKGQRFVFFTEENTPIITIPVHNRRSMFRNFYFSKLWIMHVFGWLVLKINVLIPKMHSRKKNWSIKLKALKNRIKMKIRLTEKEKKNLFFKKKNFKNYVYYKDKYNLLKNLYIYNKISSINKQNLSSLSWF